MLSLGVLRHLKSKPYERLDQAALDGAVAPTIRECTTCPSLSVAALLAAVALWILFLCSLNKMVPPESWPTSW